MDMRMLYVCVYEYKGSIKLTSCTFHKNINKETKFKQAKIIDCFLMQLSYIKTEIFCEVCLEHL